MDHGKHKKRIFFCELMKESVLFHMSGNWNDENVRSIHENFIKFVIRSKSVKCSFLSYKYMLGNMNGNMNHELYCTIQTQKWKWKWLTSALGSWRQNIKNCEKTKNSENSITN